LHGTRITVQLHGTRITVQLHSTRITVQLHGTRITVQLHGTRITVQLHSARITVQLHFTRITVTAMKVLWTETRLSLASTSPSNFSGNYTYHVSRSENSAICQHSVHLHPRQFAPSPGLCPLCFLPPVAPTSCGRFYVFGNMAASFCTSSFHLFLGLPARLVTWRPPPRLRFVVRHPFCMPSPLQYFYTHVRYPVSVRTFV
jgi:hypothetical protein